MFTTTGLNIYQAVLVVLFITEVIVHGMVLGIVTYEFTVYRDYSELQSIEDAYLALLVVTGLVILVSLIGILPAIFWPCIMICWGILYLILTLLRVCCGWAAHLMMILAIAKHKDHYLPDTLIHDENGNKRPVYNTIMGLVISGFIGDFWLLIMMLTTTVACFFCGYHCRKEQKVREAQQQMQKKIQPVSRCQQQQRPRPTQSPPRTTAVQPRKSPPSSPAKSASRSPPPPKHGRHCPPSW